MSVFHIVGDDTLGRGIYSVSQGEIIDWGARYSNIPCAVSKDNSNYIYVNMDKAITNEDKFYNSTVNELLDNSVTNIYNEDEKENEKYEPLVINDTTGINGTYTDKEYALANSGGYGSSYSSYNIQNGKIEYWEEYVVYQGTYIQKDNKLIITYTKAYSEEQPVELDKYSDELTIISETKLVKDTYDEFIKEEE